MLQLGPARTAIAGHSHCEKRRKEFGLPKIEAIYGLAFYMCSIVYNTDGPSRAVLRFSAIIFESESSRKTAAKRRQQGDSPADADFSAQQRAEEASFFTEEFEPRLRVGGDGAVCLADQALPHVNALIANGDSRLARLGAGKREVIDGVEAFAFVGLKSDSHAEKKAGDG